MTQNFVTTYKTDSCNSKIWLKLPWKKFQKNIYRLQKIIYEASKNNDIIKVVQFQKLILSSYQARLLAIRQVTDFNKNKKFIGIDEKITLTIKERFELEKLLEKNIKSWKHQPLKKFILKQKKLLKTQKSILENNQKIINIPTLQDRAWQCLIKMILEPAHEAHFHPYNYGFRPGRTAHDIQQFLFQNLNSKSNGPNKKVLILNIENSWNQLDSKYFLEKTIAPQYVKESIQKCLILDIDSFVTFPFLEKQNLQNQINILNPLLANIVLNGIENLYFSARYGTHMIILSELNADITQIINNILLFLKKRGLIINEKETTTTTITTGFDFLGWHFIVIKDGRFKSFPSKESYKTIKKKLKTIINSSAYGAIEKTKILEPVVLEWRNYNKYCDMQKHNLWYTASRAWKVFNKQRSLNRFEVTKLIKKAFPSVSYSQNRYISVQDNKSPYDGDFLYWSKRNTNYIKSSTFYFFFLP